jgi:hypothetical protein
MVSVEKLIEKIHVCGLKSCHIVKYSGGYIKSTQASQWINFRDNGRGLSKAVVMMIWMMCERLEVEKTFGETKSISTENDLPKTEMKFKGNSFLTSDKINVMPYCYIRKANGVYFNIDGDIYLNEGVDDICIFEEDGKERKVKIGSGTFGKLEIIS